MKKLAIITTHPIQYNAPLFKLLTGRNKIAIKIFYTWGEAVLQKKYDPGFGKVIEWDIPLLDGYVYEFVENVAKDPGSHHFAGINNPGLIAGIESWKADAVLVYGWSFKSHLKAMKYFKGKIPVFFRGDSTLLDAIAFPKKILRRIVLRYVYRYVDVALFAGTANRSYFTHAGLRDSQLAFAPHAVDNERFSCNEKEREQEAKAWRGSIAVPEDAIVFLYAGKFESKKDPFGLLEAFEKSATADVYLVFAGNGELESQLKQRAAGNSGIKFINFVNQQQMPVLYRIADVFVLPSKGPGETWGLSINEAMASGRAVLVSDRCGAAIDLVKNGENGRVFTGGETLQLQHSIEWFINNRNRVKEMGLRSREIINNWSYEKLAEVIEKVTNEI